MKRRLSNHLVPTRALLAVLALLFSLTGFGADDVPHPPCGSAPTPSYSKLDAQPAVRVWNGSSQRLHVPSACNAVAEEFGTVIAIAGTFRFGGNSDSLLTRIGAVSAMQGMSYWSVSDEKWSPLITHSSAVTDSRATQPRPDFTPLEMKQGNDLFFVQRDGRSTGPIVYRLRVREATNDRIVVEIENVSPVRKYVFTMFKAGELRTVHYLTRASADVWNYYQLSLVRTAQSDRAMPSLINRAGALYRYAAGKQTDAEPPFAR